MPDERVAWAVQLRARAAVQALSVECEREGIKVLPVKGIVTSKLLYDGIAERPMLDVRVLPADLERALAPPGGQCLQGQAHGRAASPLSIESNR